MKALLIEVDFRTGKRAGGINPKDPNLQCYGWQDLESKPGREIRIVEDDRDLSKYKDVPGVTILNGKAAINKAITANIPAKYGVKDPELLLAHLKEKKISLDTLAGKSLQDGAKEFYAQGLAGIVERKPKLV
ncbi:hypothetical protein LCGC14_2947540 [marine sediment metagenome]|uniref:Uncharacterized protein n=1 Tax=marine sediment metagenome TaxID=412755 RepID=A0A0F9A7E6_9ZZZZ